MLPPKIKRNIGRIIPFGVIWLIFSIVYVLLEKGLLGSLRYYPSTTNPYNFSRSIFFTPVFALLTGLAIGTIEVLYFNKFFVQKSFAGKIIYKALIYLTTIIFFLTLTSIIANSLELQRTVLDQQVWNNAWAFFADYASLSVGVYMAAVIIISQFYAEVSENIGQVVLTNFFTGKYHQPQEEERIFMFLDMKSSTRIAEKLQLTAPYQTRSLGENELRGRNERMALFTIFSA
jgi:adenylate cyclase